MYLRCNTYARVKGGYALYVRARRAGRRALILRGTGRAAFVPSFVVLRPGPTWSSYLSRPTPHGCGTIFQPRLWSPPWTLLPAGFAYSYIIFAREILEHGSAHTCLPIYLPCVPGKNRLVTAPTTGARHLANNIALKGYGRD